MRLKKITFFLLVLSSVLNIIFSNFLHQGVIGVSSAIVCLLIAAATMGKKDNKNSVKEK
jgi:di/tricarboxylate transporter